MDIKKLSDIHGLTVEEFSEIVEIFIDTARIDIERLRVATGSGDAVSAGEAAHSLKGAAGNLGFMELSEMARTAEIHAENNELEKIESNLSLMDDQLENIIVQFGASI